MFKFILFCSQEKQFHILRQHLLSLGIDTKHILHANSNLHTRIQFINQNIDTFLFFLDHDCLPTLTSLEIFETIRNENENNKNIVVTGFYENPRNAHYLQKIHNFIANNWLEISYQTPVHASFLLGGVFVIKANELLVDSGLNHFWGAEDKYLSELFHKQNFNFVCEPKLKVIHNTSAKWSHFFNRAWLHGVNDVVYTSSYLPSNRYLYWLKKIDYSNLYLMPLILLHFCIQKMAKLFQTIRQPHKS